MKKQELLNTIERAIDHHMENDASPHSLGSDCHNIAVKSDKYDDVIILGHFGKRRIEGISVLITGTASGPGLLDECVYDVTNEIINHDTEDGGLYKDGAFEDRDTAAKSIFDTILSAASNINALLSENTVESLKACEGELQNKLASEHRNISYTPV